MRVVALDLETYLIKPGQQAPKPVVMSAAERRNGAIHNYLTRDWRGQAMQLLSDRTVHLVGHNIAFDLGCLYQHIPEARALIWEAYDAGRIGDTGIRDRIILLASGRRSFDSRLGVVPTLSLAEAVRRNLVDAASFDWWAAEKLNPESWRLRYSELDHVDLLYWPQTATSYALADSELTLRVWEAQQQASDDYQDTVELVRNESDQNRAAWALHLVSAWGMHTDPVQTSSYEDKWAGLLGSFRETLIDAGLIRTQGGKPVKDTAAIRQRVSDAFAAQGLTPPLTESGAISTEREVLEESGDPTLAVLASLTKVEKLISTYLPVLKSGILEPIHTRFEVMVDTGRTSSSQPNIQNIPRDSWVKDPKTGQRVPLSIREAFVPRPGHVFVSVDYDTLELRTLAQAAIWYTGHSELGRVLNEGLDPHLDLAALMLGVSYDEAKRLKDAEDKNVSFYRTLAKAGNFGFPGGMSANSFGDYAKATTGGELRLTRTQSHEIKAYWQRRWTEMPDYFRSIEAQRRGAGYMMQLFGSDLVRYTESYTAACNTPFQSLAAHGAKRSLYAAARAAFHERESPLFASRPVMFIHDEIIAEVPESVIHEASFALSEIMCRTMQIAVPDVKITASPAAMRRWYKAAAPAFDQNKRLVCWEPKLKP